jgi:urease accessory protein UreE
MTKPHNPFLHVGPHGPVTWSKSQNPLKFENPIETMFKENGVNVKFVNIKLRDKHKSKSAKPIFGITE